MFSFQTRPALFHLGKFPIAITELVILLQLVGMIFVVFSQGAIQPFMAFQATAFSQGALWQAITYPFFSGIDPFLLLGLFFFYQFGRSVEQSLGQKPFALLCIGAILLGPIIYLLSHAINLPGGASLLIGNSPLHLAVFCCFCVMYPNVPTMLLQIPIKWLGLVSFGLAILSSIQIGNVALLVTYTVTTAAALYLIQSKGLSLVNLIPSLPKAPRKSKSPKKLHKFKKSKKIVTAREAKIKPRAKASVDTDIDKILDKISEKGLHSLSDDERELLSKLKK